MHRSRSLLTRALSAAAVVAVLALGGFAAADSASAASPTPTPSAGSPTQLVYQVHSTSYSIDPSGAHIDPQAQDGPFTIDCSTKPCTLAAFVAGGVELTVPGTTHLTIPGSGNVCASTFQGTVTLVITIGVKLTGTYDRTGAPETSCANGGSSEVDASHEDFAGTLVSGDSCLVGGPCASATPAAPASVVGIPLATTRPRTFATPSVLSTLPTIAEATRPANLAWAAALTVILVLLIALPTNLLNSAVEHGTERLGAWRKKVWPALSRDAATARAAGPRASAPDADASHAPTPDAGSALAPVTAPAPAPVTKPVAFAGWPLAAAGVLAASLISSFVDPAFGFNGASLRTFFSILVSFLLDAVAGWFLLIWLVRRAIPSATARFQFAPATLLIVLAAVLFTRLTGFQPGIVFGLVAGVAFGAVVATADKARNALIGLGYSFVVAIIGWIGWSLLAGVAHPNGVVVFVQETLSSMAIGGIAALPIALVPLRGLTGHAVFTWNRWAWAGGYAIGLFGFFFVLMPFPFAWKGVPLSIGVWLGIYLLYAAVAVVAWLVLARPWKKEQVEAEESATATPESVA